MINAPISYDLGTKSMLILALHTQPLKNQGEFESLTRIIHPQNGTRRTMTRRIVLWTGIILLAAMFEAGNIRLNASSVEPEERMNVLFIAVDDLRPELGCYGNTRIQSPHIDQLASKGILFENAYCQVPVCGASRASLLTGIRPTRTRFLSYDTWAMRDAPGVPSLPQYFREHGYTTISLGKVFHHATDCPESWTETPWRPRTRAGNWRDYQTSENMEIAAANDGKGPAFECADVPDEAYNDGQIAQRASETLQQLKEQNKPFFLAVGFLKPHLPFNAPKRFWDAYPSDQFQVPDNYYPPRNVPRQAMHNWGELRGYHGIPQKGILPEDQVRTLIHGYYACVSYTDAMIGKVLETLEKLELSDRTIVVLWGDHGWNLGEHTLWCKHCNFYNALHVPLILHAPGKKSGARISQLVEFIDIYPTLCDLVGLDQPSHLHGNSMTPLIDGESTSWKEAVFSRWIAGDTIITKNYAFTEWYSDGQTTARMLFDHRSDPAENVNVAEEPARQGIIEKMSALLKENRLKASETAMGQ